MPGFIDMHVHLREPGREDKETVLTGTQAAIHGGFTSIACMPNTTPVADNETVVESVLYKAMKANLADVYPCGTTAQSRPTHRYRPTRDRSTRPFRTS